MKISTLLRRAVSGSSNSAGAQTTTTTTPIKKPQSTLAFRIINPELFIKPNKHVMNFGIAAIAGCVMYFAYMVATHDPKKTATTNKEKTFSVKTGQLSNRSKWD